MEMALHEKERERERAQAHTWSLRRPASQCRAHGRARAHACVRTCGLGGWGAAGCRGRAAPARVRSAGWG